ncbi:MAG: hypothetical protein AAFV49_14240 [Pseudomonadota bacterium]
MSRVDRLELKLYGPFAARWEGGPEVDIRSAKLRALLALLATAPEARRSRAWMQDMLWSRSGPEHGRASLRQALSALRSLFGDRFDALFDVNKEGGRLRPGASTVIGSPSDGSFLEGIDIAEDGFEDWLRQRRAAGEGREEFAIGAQRVRPAIAVIPFLTLGQTEEDTILGDAISLEITRALSRTQLLTVISHLSARCIDPRTVVLRDLRQLLDVDYVICGSLRRRGDVVMLDLDFVDAEPGRVRWTRSYTARPEEVLLGDGVLVGTIAAEIGQTILTTSIETSAGRPLPDVQSHALLMSAIALMHHMSLASFSRARSHLEEVIQRAPRHSIPHSWLAQWYLLSVTQGWSVDVAKDSAIASDCAKRALDLHPRCPLALTMDGNVKNVLVGEFDEALERFNEALAVDPNNTLGWLLKGVLHAFIDQGEQAVAYTARARTLSPLDPRADFFDSLSATAHLANRDYETALELAERSLAVNTRHISTMRVRTIALARLGREDEARAAGRALLRKEPDFTVSRYLSRHPAAEFRTGREWADALRAAGIPPA